MKIGAAAAEEAFVAADGAPVHHAANGYEDEGFCEEDNYCDGEEHGADDTTQSQERQKKMTSSSPASGGARAAAPRRGSSGNTGRKEHHRSFSHNNGGSGKSNGTHNNNKYYSDGGGGGADDDEPTPFTTAEEVEMVLDSLFPYPIPTRIQQSKLDYYLNTARGPPRFTDATAAKAFLYSSLRILGTEEAGRAAIEEACDEMLADWVPHREALLVLHAADRRGALQLFLREERLRGLIEEETEEERHEAIALPLLAARLFFEKGGLTLESLPILASFEEDEANERDYAEHREDAARGGIFDVMIEELVAIEQREEAEAEAAAMAAEAEAAAAADEAAAGTSSDPAAAGMGGTSVNGRTNRRSFGGATASTTGRRSRQSSRSPLRQGGDGAGERSRSASRSNSPPSHVGAPYNSVPALSTADLAELRSSRSATPNPLNPYSYGYDRSSGSITPLSRAGVPSRRGQKGSAQQQQRPHSSSCSDYGYSYYSSGADDDSHADGSGNRRGGGKGGYYRWAENSLQLFSHRHHKSDRTYAADYVAHRRIAGRTLVRTLGDARRADAAEAKRLVAQRTREENMHLRAALEQAKVKALRRSFAHVVRSRDAHKSQRKAFITAREAHHEQLRKGHSTKYMAYKWDLHMSKYGALEQAKLDELMGGASDQQQQQQQLSPRSAAKAERAKALALEESMLSLRERERRRPSFASPTARSLSVAHNSSYNRPKSSGPAMLQPPPAATVPPNTPSHARAVAGLAPLPPFKAPPKAVFGHRSGSASASRSGLSSSAGTGGGYPQRLRPLEGSASASSVPLSAANASQHFSRPHTAGAPHQLTPIAGGSGGAAAAMSTGPNRGYYFTNRPITADGGSANAVAAGGNKRGASAKGPAAKTDAQPKPKPKRNVLPVIIHPAEARLVELAQCYSAMLTTGTGGATTPAATTAAAKADESTKTTSGQPSAAAKRGSGAGGGAQQPSAAQHQQQPQKPIRIELVPPSADAAAANPVFVFIAQTAPPSNTNITTSSSTAVPPSSAALFARLLALPHEEVEARGSLLERAAWCLGTSKVLAGRIGRPSSPAPMGGETEDVDGDGATSTAGTTPHRTPRRRGGSPLATGRSGSCGTETSFGSEESEGAKRHRAAERQRRQQQRDDSLAAAADALFIEGERLLRLLERYATAGAASGGNAASGGATAAGAVGCDRQRGGSVISNASSSSTSLLLPPIYFANGRIGNPTAAASSPPNAEQQRSQSQGFLVDLTATLHCLAILRRTAAAAVLRATRQTSQALAALEAVAALEAKGIPRSAPPHSLSHSNGGRKVSGDKGRQLSTSTTAKGSASLSRGHSPSTSPTRRRGGAGGEAADVDAAASRSPTRSRSRSSSRSRGNSPRSDDGSSRSPRSPRYSSSSSSSSPRSVSGSPIRTVSPSKSPARAEGGGGVGYGDTAVGGGHVSQGGVGGSSSSPLRPCDRINPHNGQRELILHDYTSGVRGGTFGKARKATASDGNDDGGGNNEEGGANDSGTSGQSPSRQQQPTSDGASPNAVTLANLATLCANLGRGDEALAHGRAACRTVTRQLEANVAAVVAALRAAEAGEGGPTSPSPSQHEQKHSSSSSSSAATVVRVTAPFPEALEMAVTVLTAIAAAQMSQQRPQTTASNQSAVVGSSSIGGGARHVLGAMPNERAAAPRTYRLALGLAEATLGKKHPMTAYCRRCVEGL